MKETERKGEQLDLTKYQRDLNSMIPHNRSAIFCNIHERRMVAVCSGKIEINNVKFELGFKFIKEKNGV